MKPQEYLLIKPLLTEKMLALQERRKYAFKVAPDANKIEVKSAIENKFNVLVDKVNIVKVKGKTKRMNTRRGLTRGKRSDWKKAIVTLKEDYVIDFFQEQQG